MTRDGYEWPRGRDVYQPRSGRGDNRVDNRVTGGQNRKG